MKGTGPSSPEATAFVKAVGAAANLPAFARNVQAISSLASDLEARVEALERAITRDMSLAAKVLRIANATSGGGAQRTVGTVKQAIMMLGFDRVQHLSAAASVFDEAEKQAPALRDLQVHSVLSANLALQLADAAGFEKPEMAYLCGMFHRFGEMLVACYRPSPYCEWTEQVKRDGPFDEGAEAQHFGFTFQEVGIALAERWGMPAAVVRTMSTFRGVSQELRLLHAITQCSTELASAMVGGEGDDEIPSELRDRVSALTGVDASIVKECIATSLSEAKPTLTGMQVNLETWRRDQVEARKVAVRTRADGGPTAAGRRARQPESAEDAATPAAADRLLPNATDTEQESRLRTALRELARQRELAQQQDQGPAKASFGEASFSVGSVTDATLRAACQAGYERGVLGINSEDRTMIRGRIGMGRSNAEFARNFLVRTSATFGPLAAALQTHTDLFIEMSGADAKAYKRDRLIKNLDPSTFALLPLVIESELIGCLYFDSTIESVAASETSRQLLRDLRDSLVAAFVRHRKSAAEDATASA
jgi:HD-like signal output (HDOD) protein